MVKGVEHYHQAGFIHKDLKSTHILLDARAGTVKRTDFGYSLHCTTKSSFPIEAVGHFAHIPPDVLFCSTPTAVLVMCGKLA